MRQVVVCGAAIVRDEARVNLDGVPDQPGVSHRVFSAIAAQNIVVDMIVQNAGSQGRAAIGFTVLRNELPATLAVLRPLAVELGASVSHEEDVSKVSVVGTGMRTHTGVAERMFAALAEARVNIKMITTGDIKISVLVNKADGVRALRAVHQAFALYQPRASQADATRAGAYRPRPASVLEDTTGHLAALTQRLSSMEEIVVSDVLLSTDQGRITIYDMPDQTGTCSRLFQAVASGGIMVDMIVQNLTEPDKAELSFSVPLGDLQRAQKLAEQVAHAIDPCTRVVGDANIARLFVFGVGMRTHTGVARRMFGALAERGINISMINTSEVCVSVVVDRERGDEALAVLKGAFNVS
jgi:aspartate kinase